MAVRQNVLGRPLKTMAPIIAWQRDVGNDVQDWIKRNHSASGKTAQSLVVVVDKPNISRLEGAEHLVFTLQGRGPGRFPRVDRIRQWISDAGIVPTGISLNSLAFLIGRKIALEGTSGPFLDDKDIESIINNHARRRLNQVGNIQAKEASDALVATLIKTIPNTTVKK